MYVEVIANQSSVVFWDMVYWYIFSTKYPKNVTSGTLPTDNHTQ